MPRESLDKDAFAGGGAWEVGRGRWCMGGGVLQSEGVGRV